MNKKRIIITIISVLLIAASAFGQEIQPETSSTPITTPTVATPGQLGPKQEGNIRIGVVTIKTKLKQDASGQDMAEIIRTRWYSFLDGPTVELIPLDARVPIQINIEAKQKSCDLILYSTMTQKTKGSLLGGLISAAVPVLTSSLPAGVGGATTSSIANSVKEGAKEAGKNMANQAASKIKANDQVTLDFAVVQVSNTTAILQISLKAKASTDGEDIFSTLIEQAAVQILETAFNKNLSSS